MTIGQTIPKASVSLRPEMHITELVMVM